MSEVKTLRDEFAMAALTGMLASPSTSAWADSEYWSQVSYVFADAMLEARAAISRAKGGSDE